MVAADFLRIRPRLARCYRPDGRVSWQRQPERAGDAREGAARRVHNMDIADDGIAFSDIYS